MDDLPGARWVCGLVRAVSRGAPADARIEIDPLSAALRWLIARHPLATDYFAPIAQSLRFVRM